MGEAFPEPPTPEGAAPAIRQLYEMGAMRRIQMFMFGADPQEIENLIIGAFATWPPKRAWEAVRDGLDIRPMVVKESFLFHFLVRPWAKKIIRRNWETIRYFVRGFENDPESGPPGIIARMRRAHSPLGPVFSLPEGWLWLRWTCYNLAVMLRDYADVKDPGFPLIAPGEPSPIVPGELPGK